MFVMMYIWSYYLSAADKLLEINEWHSCNYVYIGLFKILSRWISRIFNDQIQSKSLIHID